MNEITGVLPEDACPDCGEDRIDYLIWNENGKVVCQRCGEVYVPPGWPREDEEE